MLKQCVPVSRDHFLARYSHIFFYTKSHKTSLNEKKNLAEEFSQFLPFFLCFAHADHFETFSLFHMVNLVFRFFGIKQLASEVQVTSQFAGNQLMTVYTK